MTAEDPVETLDLSGLKCPLPALKAGKRLERMAAGERLVVKTSDPLAVIDIPNMCRESGHRLIETSPTGNDGHRFLIERG